MPAHLQRAENAPLASGIVLLREPDHEVTQVLTDGEVGPEKPEWRSRCTSGPRARGTFSGASPASRSTSTLGARLDRAARQLEPAYGVTDR